ncbi:aspartic peptidase domain-containing protein [Russula compacta]|nr:aspartic peptidase domain-containing protein [Russula compacta]
MLPPPLTFLLTTFLYLSSRVAALSFNLRGELISPHLHRRDHIAGLDNNQNLKYFTNITLGEKEFSVSIDTGSSDTWVAGNILNSNNTGVSAGVQYAVGGISGNVKTAPLTFLNFSVPDQAFIQVQPTSTYPEGQGLIGLGPNVGSNIYDALKKSSRGDTVLDRIFRQNTSTPNTLTILLSRSDDPNEQYPGQITVSDIIPGRESILDQPKLTVRTVASSRSGDQHWLVLIDPNGVIGPDGQPIALSTNASSVANSSALSVIFDTGFSFNQVPKNVASAIYSRIPGAQFENLTTTGPIWTLPCGIEINTTLLFSNKSFPIHPFDMNVSMRNSSGDQICVGGFQPITTGAAPDYDVILGMAFLRNVYLLINYGNFVDRTTTKAPPYVQLLSVTDPAAAHLDFVNARLGGVDTTGMQMFSTDSPVSSPGDVTSPADRKTRIIVIFSAVGGSFFLVAVAAAVYIALRRRRRRLSVPDPNVSTINTGLSHDYTTLQHTPPPGEMHLLMGEAGLATRDPFAETTRASLAPVGEEEDHNVSPSRYEGRDSHEGVCVGT